VATQFHPEFLSRPLRPSPPFLGFVLAACGELEKFLADPEHKWIAATPATPL
jgi:CTP synthase